MNYPLSMKKEKENCFSLVIHLFEDSSLFQTDSFAVCSRILGLRIFFLSFFDWYKTKELLMWFLSKDRVKFSFFWTVIICMLSRVCIGYIMRCPWTCSWLATQYHSLVSTLINILSTLVFFFFRIANMFIFSKKQTVLLKKQDAMHNKEVQMNSYWWCFFRIPPQGFVNGCICGS